MAEFDPKLTSDTSASDPEKKPRKRNRRKSRVAEVIGGQVTNESLIWARDKETVPKPKKTAERLAETLKHIDRTEESDEKPVKKVEKPDESAEVTDDDVEQVAALAELSPDEVRHAMDEYVQVRGMEVAAEQVVAKPDSAEAAALTADAEMLDKLREKLAENPEADPEQIAEQAYQEALQELPPAEAEPVLVDEASATAPEHSAATHAEDTAPEEQSPVATGGQPPVPPRSVLFPNVAPGGPPVSFEYVPTPPEQRFGPGRSVISIEEALHAERRAETRGLLLGGLIGYFIGRRRGRIKTEKRLIPVQEKLEKQVRSLHETIADKEAKLREEAARRSAQSREHASQLKRITEAKPVVKAEILPQRQKVESAPSLNQPEVSVNAFENLPGGPMVQLAGEVAAATAAMTATAMERTRDMKVESTMINDASKELAADRIQNMSVPELLAASETVVIGGERLRDIYESHRITEPGLRHVMAEYVRGGHPEKALQQEIHNKELTYERDPRMRKTLATKLATTGSKAADRAGKLATGAKPALAASTEQAKKVGKKVVSQVVSTARKLDNPSNPVQQVVVRTWAAVTVVLALIALVLLFK